MKNQYHVWPGCPLQSTLETIKHLSTQTDLCISMCSIDRKSARLQSTETAHQMAARHCALYLAAADERTLIYLSASLQHSLKVRTHAFFDSTDFRILQQFSRLGFKVSFVHIHRFTYCVYSDFAPKLE